MLCQVLNLLDSVKINESRRFDCPLCNSRNSLSITNQGDKYQYNCFDANCTLYGNRKIRADSDTLTERLLNRSISPSDKFVPPEYWIYAISAKKCVELLTKHHCMTPYLKGYFQVAYDPREDRLVFLIKKDGELVGGCGRTLSNQRPKTKNYHSNEVKPFMAGTGKIGVIVEDCLSACAVSQVEGHVGIALLGTDYKENYIPYLTDFTEVIIALDKDVKKKALDLLNYLRYYHNKVCVRFIPKDIKNMELQEIFNIFKQG